MLKWQLEKKKEKTKLLLKGYDSKYVDFYLLRGKYPDKEYLDKLGRLANKKFKKKTSDFFLDIRFVGYEEAMILDYREYRLNFYFDKHGKLEFIDWG